MRGGVVGGISGNKATGRRKCAVEETRTLPYGAGAGVVVAGHEIEEESIMALCVRVWTQKPIVTSS